MRPTVRLFARYLEAGTPTGLTGLWTHGSARSTLLYLYGTTLSRLQSMPETSVYRQSVEAVTKHRMALVEEMVPPGYDQWAAKAKELVSNNAAQFRVASGRLDGSEVRTVKLGDKVFIVGRKHEAGDIREEEWDGEANEGGELEGIRTAAERQDQALWAERKPLENHEQVEWEDEPQLTADQISELEHKIGAGLIEEVIQVAEGELNLIDTIEKAKVWEDLEEKPVDGHVSRPAHLPHDSINPLSHSPGMVHQFATAGLAETDEDPSQHVPDFPHRTVRGGAAGRNVEPDSDADETETEAEADDDDDDDVEASGRGKGKKKKKKKEATARSPWKGGHYEVLLESVHQFLDRGDIDKAARSYGLLLQLRPGGAFVDIRRHSLWAIGAEILMRQGEQPVDGARTDGDDGDGDSDDLAATPGGLRRWGRAANMNKVKAYFDTLIQQHPYDYKHPRAVCAVDFWVAMLSCEIYNVHSEHMMALDRAEACAQDDSQLPFGADDSFGSDEAEAREAPLQRKKEELRLQALATMQVITKRMGTVMQESPYSKNSQLLRLRAMAALYIADLVVPVAHVSLSNIRDAQRARQMEQQVARDSLLETVNNGGQHDKAALTVLYPSDESGRDPATSLYSSLPIRGL
ncbi:hypothetical protein EDB81DRAFT_694931 [Dactylonectria macrodidyma]|uniref:Uncharacterized protein n=1 Tax=Dactylonectria macrodidyma TaxID=307937 RepID=A0A9P9IU44_9HYPO|nr:hypothetical protein EDB81DRAFT_694931 [Dactylonectria macrodidyma]